ncbi:DNA ligase D [Actinobacteria bacterium YIM 96077]|uniref:DNA ligase (ATP) n=1 Tax=Phytoactinopolyspora halophila TaxID=1981511 RepID=A0A329QF61_9ACTN|nr:DNA ligase D [Phytoactinopolyspora halophila]AYY14043.1 DNA ligase D [Actinobacteria bacterium YIM 96077]RAW10950.1 DNA ligase D [Phytoactinopolyspora halophila]
MAASRRLREYRQRRSFGTTPEPQGGDERHATTEASGNRFVIQEHHASRLHWDLRLEHDGVLMSWALPRGLPDDPDQNRLAIHTEDHPVEYLTFEGEIPRGEYGAGTMTIWDRGTYVAEKFEDDKLVVELTGERVHGTYALFQTENNWLIHRMDRPEAGSAPAPTSGNEPVPDTRTGTRADTHPGARPGSIEPMKAVPAESSQLPSDEDAWAFEVKWDGVRALAFRAEGSLRLISRTGTDITKQYPEIAPLARQLGARQVVLDGELVAFDDNGRPSFQHLQPRMNVTSDAKIRQHQRTHPVTYIIFDLLHLDGRSVMDQPYTERRRELEELDLDEAHWQVPGYHRGDARALLEATREQGIEGLIAKRLDSPYRPGRRSGDWLKVKNVYRQEMVIGGWTAGTGSREGSIGALLIGYYDDDGTGDGAAKLRYAGKVGTGFDSRTLRDLHRRLKGRERSDSPFTGRQPPKGAVFAEPELVCEVEFREWTRSGTVRQASYQGLRDDKPAREVVRETPAGAASDTESNSDTKSNSGAASSSDNKSSSGTGHDGTRDRLPEGTVTVEGRTLKLTNLDKIFYPDAGVTKGDVIEYYRALAPALLPHLRGRPLTMKRYPDGVRGENFFEKRCPQWRPDWVTTISIYSDSQREEIEYCVVEDLPTLLWTANLASLELHTLLATAQPTARSGGGGRKRSGTGDPERPTMVVFDLDPGQGSGLADCARVATSLRDLFDHLDLEVLVKSSGSKGLHLAIPLNTDVTYDDTKPFAHAVAQLAEKEWPDDVVSRMTKSRRRGKVLVDWSQNSGHKTTVAPFSLRAREHPTVSVPLSWPEVEAVASSDAEPASLLLDVDQVLQQIDERSALFQPLLERQQSLPDLS